MQGFFQSSAAMPAKTTKQTSFRADRALLTEFQNRLNSRDKEMSPVIEGWIREFVRAEGDEESTIRAVREGPLGNISDDEKVLLEKCLEVVRFARPRGPEALELVRETLNGALRALSKWPESE
jgi:hypothetical protein